MKILLLGATGKVGHLVLNRALEQGYDVLALVRNPAKITQTHRHLIVQAGSLFDAPTVTAAMAGTDAVISALGHNSLKTSDIQTATTRIILAALRPGQRFISLTGQGVSDPKDPPLTLATRLITAGIKAVPGKMYQDGADHAQLMRQSQADWVLVRAPVMVAGSLTHKYQTGYFKIGLTTVVRRADVADFMVANITDNTWLRQAPLIATTSFPVIGK